MTSSSTTASETILTMAWTTGTTMARGMTQRKRACTELVRHIAPLCLCTLILTNSRPAKLSQRKSSPRRRLKTSHHHQRRPRLVLIVRLCQKSRRMLLCRGFSATGMSLTPRPPPKQVLDRESGNPPQITAMMIAPPPPGLLQIEGLRTDVVVTIVIATHSGTLPRMDPQQTALTLESTYPRTTV